MKHIVRPVVTALAVLFGCVSGVFAQALTYDPSVFIDININSGNPNYPYPQFLEYKGGGKSLAKYNAEGVTHADMEKAGREAYEIMMHRCRYEGTYCGVKYISFNRDDVAGNYGTFVSEGDGYAMLAAAIFADQKTFNGLYMWVHDIRFSGVKRFRDGRTRGTNANDFAGPYLAAWKDKTFDAAYGSDSHSATDGDVDIAMAMLVAYKQWGEWLMQDGQVIKDSEGNPISLKYEAQRVIGALVDTLGQWDKGSGALTGMLCGVIGIDGYEKRGNSWGELTRWRFTNEANARYPGVNGPNNVGPNLYGIYGGNYIDYDAPSYFEEFWRWLKNGDGTDEKNKDRAEWEIHQFKRAAASGNWLNKQAYDQGLYASIGRVDMETDGQPKFGVYVDGEDFRYAWRHLIDYLWHGDADYDWDPKTHQVIDGTNTSERDMGVRHAELLKNPSKAGTLLCSKMGASPDPGQPSWFGVSQIPQQWTPTGDITSAYHTNYSVGAGSPAAVISEDLELVADIYRQCEIMWDGNNTAAKLDPEERYIGSTPKYFHGWFRTLGMLVCSGNLAAPEDMKPIANAKVYMSVDKTYAYQGDNVTYGVQYRNYGTLDAEGVKITTKLDPNYTFVSATKGGVYNSSDHSISWNIGSIKGFKTGGLAATMDSVAFTVNVADTLNPRICLTSKLTASNCDGWESNEFPNHATYTMERNCVDILANRSLSIKKTANRNALNPNDVVTFTVEFENKSEGESSWLNGGRDNVRISYGTHSPSPTYQFYSLYRFWNDAYESYINMGNYRVSYFMYDAAAIGLYDATRNTTGWTFVVDNQNDLDKYGYNPSTGPITFSYQKIPQGEDQFGKWNQRLMIRFADVLMAPSTHVYDKLDSQYLLHKGVWGPGFIRARLASNPNQDLSSRVTDDWSYDVKVGGEPLDGQGTTFTLISPCWANYDNPGYEITNYARHVCSPTKVKNYERVLVEEFDGYTWRRIQGTGPLPGKEAYNVTVVDTIPYELEWVGWIDSTALKNDAGEKIKAKYTPCSDPKGKGYTGVVYWTVPEMLVGEADKLVYRCKARDLGCPTADDAYYENVSWIWSDTDSPDSSQVELMTTCTELPPQIEPQTSLFKTSDRKRVEEDETVSYQLKFVNTEGTHLESSCKSTDGWIKLGNGTLPAVGTSGLKLSTNGNGTPYFFAPEYAYGTDGSVYATIGGSPSSTQSLFIVFRYVSGTPGQNGFKGVCMQLLVNQDGKNNFGYRLYNGDKMIASEGLTWADATQFPGNNESPTFKFVLEGDHLYMYVNDFEDEWTNVLKDWTGLTFKDPGHWGMYVNSNGNANTQLTTFTTDLDYGFNIELSDKLPSELGDISSISGGGTYNASNHEIKWPVEATSVSTALAPGDSIVKTFDAKVITCGKYINNMGIATVFGQDTLKVLNTIECGVEECELIKAEIQFEDDMDKICEGDSVLLVGFGDDGKDGSRFLYEFFLDDVSLGRASSKGEIFVKKSGSYYVKVSSPVDPTCFLESKKVTLTVNERPVGQDFPLGTLCVGTMPNDNAKYTEMITVIDNRPSDVNYSWVGDHGGVPAVFPNVSTDAVGDFDKPYFLLSNGCVSDTFHLTYTVADTAVVKLSDLTICSGQAGTLTAGTDLTYTYLWSDGSSKNELVTDQPGKYSVVVTTPEGCESKASATITVADELKVDLGADTTICEGNLPLVLDASSSYDTYEWTDGSTLSTLSVTEAGEYEVKVTQGSCSGSGKINVTVSPTPVLKGTFKVTYLVNDTTATGVFDKSLTAYDANVLEKESGITYSWYDESKNKLADEPIPAVPAGGGNTDYTYYVKAENVDGCESDFQKVSVLVSGSPMPSADDVVYCLNDPSAKALEATPTDNGSNTLWTLAWYDAAGNLLSDAPVPDVSVVGETKYFVSQIDQQGTEGGKTPVTVTVYALPQLKAEPQDVKLCGDPYELSTAFREENGLPVSKYNYYDADKNLLPEGQSAAEKSGVYYAKAYYSPVTDLLCESADFAAVNVSIDKITDIQLTASPSICPYGETVLSATAKSEDTPLEISWKGDATSDEPTLNVKDETGEYGKVYSFSLEIKAGVCVFDSAVTVTVGRGVLTGALSANGVETKKYLTCGDEDIVLSATHEGQDFKWTNYDGDLIAEDISATVHPSQTTTYILSFVNECETSDTLVVEVYPLSLSTNFAKLDTSVCEDESASAKLIVNNYDEDMEGSYIKWFKDDVELTKYAGSTELILTKVAAEDAGKYTFEVSNGICLAKSLDGVTSALLTVKPFVSFSLPGDLVTANGGPVSLELKDLVPSDAVVVWKGSVNEGVGNPYQIDQIFADESLDVHVSAEGYCDRDGQVQVLVDAKVLVSASTSTPKICLDESASLVADTSGTGHLLYPEKYSIVWYACDESGNCGSLQMKGTELTHYPEASLSYYAVVTYGEQVVHSDTIPVSVIPKVSYVASADGVSCSGEDVTLSVEIENAPEALVTWADGTESNSLTVTPTEATNYLFVITQEGLCPQTDSVAVTVKEKPAIEMEEDIVVCSGQGVRFNPTVTGDEIDGYHWINPNGDTIAHTLNLSFNMDPVSGTYTFVASSKSCGESKATQSVEVAPLPELYIDSLTINSRKLVPIGRAGQYEFKLDNKEWSTEDVYENLTYDYPHTAFVRDELGCENMLVFVVKAPPIAIPDYFTPSEDGMNDTWDLTTIMDAYPNTKTTIYDRTGKVVAVLEGDATEWDGTYNGVPLPSTDYWYLINVPELRKQFTGHFTLIRTK